MTPIGDNETRPLSLECHALIPVNRGMQRALVIATGRILVITFQLSPGTDMTKLIAAIMAALFAVATLSPVALAADQKKEQKKDSKKDSKKDKKAEEQK